MKRLLIVLILFFSYASYSQTADEYLYSGIEKAENGDYYGGIADYNKAIELKPNPATSYYNRGRSKYYLKDYYGAIEDYNKAIELNPNAADAYNNRGMAKKQLKVFLGFFGACKDWKIAASMGHIGAQDNLRMFCK